MIDIKQDSLFKALHASSCRDLPKVFNENGLDFWLEAIACVRKRDGSTSYCLVEHRYDGKIVYRADYGSSSPIFALLSIHPYVMLDRNAYMSQAPDDLFLEQLVRGKFVTYDEAKYLTEVEINEWRIKLAIRLQREAVERYNATGVAEDMVEDVDDDGFKEITADTSHEDENTKMIGEDGEVEEFVDIADVNSVYKADTKKRGRKPKNK